MNTIKKRKIYYIRKEKMWQEKQYEKDAIDLWHQSLMRDKNNRK